MGLVGGQPHRRGRSGIEPSQAVSGGSPDERSRWDLGRAARSRTEVVAAGPGAGSVPEALQGGQVVEETDGEVVDKVKGRAGIPLTSPNTEKAVKTGPLLCVTAALTV